MVALGVDPSWSDEFSLCAKLASLVCNTPVRLRKDDWNPSTIAFKDIELLREIPAFTKPLDSFLKSRETAAPIVASEDFVDKLRSDPNHRLAVSITTLPKDRLDTVTLHVSAAILHEKILHCVTKQQRQNIQQCFGQDALNTAMREARAFYPDLAALGNLETFGSIFTTVAEGSDLDAEHPFKILSIGYDVIYTFLQRHEECLAGLIQRRTPEHEMISIELDDKQMPQVARLLRHKGSGA